MSKGVPVSAHFADAALIARAQCHNSKQLSLFDISNQAEDARRCAAVTKDVDGCRILRTQRNRGSLNRPLSSDDSGSMQSEIEPDVTVALDGRTVNFKVKVHGTAVYCSVTRQTLEEWFWLPRLASDEKLLKTFFDGLSRISAVATRKALRAGTVEGRLVLEKKDFQIGT